MVWPASDETSRHRHTRDSQSDDDVGSVIGLIESAAISDGFRPEDAYAVDAEEEAFDHDNKVPEAPKKYRIAMFAWESLHSIAVGGVAPHLTNLAAGLERRGHEVHVYVRSGAGQEPFEIIDGVYVHRVSFELCADFVNEIYNMCNTMVAEFFNTERFMGQQFDVVHAHDWLAAPALINIKRNHNRKCVFTVHSTEYGRCGNKIYGGQSERIRNIEGEAINVADRVIAVSGVLCDEVKAHYHFNWDNLRRVYNGIQPLPYDGALWDTGYVRGQYGVGPMDPMVLFVGRMASQKGPDILVEAIPMILASRADAKFVMVGDGYMKSDLYERCAELGILGSTIWPGSMSGQPLIDLFKACDVVCIPSRNEPFGIVTLEAWAASKPVVVSRNGGPREFVSHDRDGFVVDADATGMAWGIGSIFANFDHSRWMGSQGKTKAYEQFSWDKIAMDTNDVYDTMYGIFPPSPEEVAASKAAAAAERAERRKARLQIKARAQDRRNTKEVARYESPFRMVGA
eukprot:Plantae.Rhodophyta-Purpureofilum_apyrenoidigerum.ctg5048.p1 GENE.Plantae.Rhodophyta-Purpureofilum_apyrenoidigerum.ctg5048~~Plantae.Rhodophyta-Purpureofilum_apyrenoidigerum.ctg5048.p1  ORF type:complete len:513 (-),score=72.77 Plantae.Rhodophyta-Purpureofilum_apyrenoidigerum.ctg5048:680-2218(-)